MTPQDCATGHTEKAHRGERAWSIVCWCVGQRPTCHAWVAVRRNIHCGCSAPGGEVQPTRRSGATHKQRPTASTVSAAWCCDREEPYPTLPARSVHGPQKLKVAAMPRQRDAMLSVHPHVFVSPLPTCLPHAAARTRAPRRGRVGYPLTVGRRERGARRGRAGCRTRPTRAGPTPTRATPAPLPEERGTMGRRQAPACRACGRPAPARTWGVSPA